MAEHFRIGVRVGSLPHEIRNQARAAYRLFAANPYHSSLHFKRVHGQEPIYSVRVGRSYRAVGLMEDGAIVWFWIGPYEQYETMLTGL